MIQCLRCGANNRETSRFCNECGQRLGESITCPSCGWKNVPNARFCNGCGGQLARKGPARVETPAEEVHRSDVTAPLVDAMIGHAASEETTEDLAQTQPPTWVDLPQAEGIESAFDHLEAVSDVETVTVVLREDSDDVLLETDQAWSGDTLDEGWLEPEPPGDFGGEEAWKPVVAPSPSVVADAPVLEADDTGEEPVVEAEAIQPPPVLEDRVGLTLSRSLMGARAAHTAARPAPKLDFERAGRVLASLAEARSDASVGSGKVKGRGRAKRADLASRIERLIGRFLGLLLLVAVIVPQFGLGFVAMPQASQAVKSGFETIDGLSTNSVVLVSFDWDAGSLGEMHPLSEVVVGHLMRRGVRVVAVSLVPQGPAFAERILAGAAEQTGRRYGYDYVNLGYLPGNESGLVSLAGDVTNLFPRDYAVGQPTAHLPVLAGLDTIDQVDLVVDLTGDEASAVRWIQQIRGRYRVPMVMVTTAAVGPLLTPYLEGNPPVLDGLVAGMSGAAEYGELLGDSPGYLRSSVDSQALGHLVLVMTIVIGNLVMLIRRRLR